MRRTLLRCVSTATLCILAACKEAPTASAQVSETALPRAAVAIQDKPHPTPQRVSIQDLVTQYALKHGVPEHLAHGIARTESRYDCRAVSAHGALGIMQVLPTTAREVGVKGNLLKCEHSLEAGMRYLKLAIERTPNLCAALTLYNQGLYARPRCTDYARKVLQHAREYQARL